MLSDNCSFHHARHVEPILRQILVEHGVTLGFQLPYSPELNPCEYAFNHIKQLLKRNEIFTLRFTELAVVNTVNLSRQPCVGRFLENAGMLFELKITKSECTHQVENLLYY